MTQWLQRFPIDFHFVVNRSRQAEAHEGDVIAEVPYGIIPWMTDVFEL